MNMEFDFSVDVDGEIEDINSYSDVTDTDCETVMKRILNNKKLVLGERSEGNCEIDNNVVTLDYRVCTELGDDWNTDIWCDEKDTFPLTEI